MHVTGRSHSNCRRIFFQKIKAGTFQWVNSWLVNLPPLYNLPTLPENKGSKRPDIKGNQWSIDPKKGLISGGIGRLAMNIHEWCFLSTALWPGSMLIATMDESSSIAPTLRVTAVTGVVGLFVFPSPYRHYHCGCEWVDDLFKLPTWKINSNYKIVLILMRLNVKWYEIVLYLVVEFLGMEQHL